MNQTEYAHARGVPPSTIFSAVQRRLIKLKPGGEVDPEQADATWYRRYLELQVKRRAAPDVEGRRQQAVTQSTAAKLLMTRRKVDLQRDATVERDKCQAEIGAAIADVMDQLRAAGLEGPIIEAIANDLGDLEVEVLRVTR